jgi:tRNA(His) guanylyltransferase
MQEKKSILDNMMARKDSFIVIRCDGRGFSKLKETGIFKKPYDQDFHDKMVKISDKALCNLFRCGMAYIISDEISFILPRNFCLFNRRIEKLLSVSAGYLSGEGSLEFYELGIESVSFDAKIFEFDTIDEVLEYLDERKNYGFRNFVYTLLRDKEMKIGKSSMEIAKETNGKPISNQIENLIKNGIDVYKMQYWKREGELIYFEPYTKEVKVGLFGARTKETVIRRKMVREKPLRFCLDDKVILSKMIDSTYSGDINERT